MRALAWLLAVALLPPHAYAAPRVKRILHLSDVHLNISVAAPLRYGADAPLELLESALDYAQRVIPDPDLLLFTGDSVAHGDFSAQFTLSAVETTIGAIERHFPINRTERLHVTAITGNADAYPNYAMTLTDPIHEVNPSLTRISHVWNASLDRDDLARFEHRGFLAYDLDDKLTVLTLNTVPYARYHVPDTASVADPFGQFAWLNATLLTLRESSRVAFIAGHIPPIVDSNRSQPQWHSHYIETYQAIVSGYSDVIKAQLFGHVHSIETRIPLTHQTPIFLTGSITPKYGNNPSFTVWEYEADTYEFLDFTVHATRLPTESEGRGHFNWKPLFRASSAYALKSRVSSYWALTDLNDRMRENQTLLETYYENMQAQARRLPPCGSSQDCRARVLCTMKWWSTREQLLTCIANESDIPQAEKTDGLRLSFTRLLLMAAGVVGVVYYMMLLHGGKQRYKRNSQVSNHRNLLVDSYSSSNRKPASPGRHKAIVKPLLQ